jgi:hypothetical protein
MTKPIAYVTGYHDGYPVVQPVDGAAVLPVGMALYAHTASEVQHRTTGTRAVVVVDRGWIFAGDVTRKNGRIKLDRAVHVFRWESIGFDGVIANPKSSKVTLKPMPNGVDLPEGAEIFCVPVSNDWGL